MGSLRISCFLTGTFGVLPLAYFYLPKVPGRTFFQSVKYYFCSDPISVDPICPQPRGGRHKGRKCLKAERGSGGATPKGGKRQHTTTEVHTHTHTYLHSGTKALRLPNYAAGQLMLESSQACGVLVHVFLSVLCSLSQLMQLRRRVSRVYDNSSMRNASSRPACRLLSASRFEPRVRAGASAWMLMQNLKLCNSGRPQTRRPPVCSSLSLRRWYFDNT